MATFIKSDKKIIFESEPAPQSGAGRAKRAMAIFKADGAKPSPAESHFFKFLFFDL